MISTKGRWARHSSYSALILCAAFQQPLAAQEAPADAQSADAIADAGEIIVTGSRIARETYDTAAPTVAVTSDDLLESGDSELSETLADLPQLSSTTNDATVTGNTQNSGLSSIQLRGLGDNRTLVLVDGRRTVSNSGITNLVSLSTIPSDFIDRVEIITGGTSSIYGSDAVAGVVNIITKKNERGLTLRARTGLTSRGDGQELTLGATWGARFADRRGYFLISGTYDRDWGIRATDREWAVRPIGYSYDFESGQNMFDTYYVNNSGGLTSGQQPASTFPPNIYSDLSSFIPGGVFSGANSSRDRFYRDGQMVPLGPDVQTGEPIEIGTTDNGNTGYFLPNRDGYNQRTGRSLILARKRYLAAAKLDYEFSDALEGFAQVQYSRIDSGETREAVGIGWDSTFPLTNPVTGITQEYEYGKIPCLRNGPCNPFVPPELGGRETPSTGVGIAWDRRFDEVGGQITENKRQTLRSWIGLRGKLSESWRWEASFGYGQYKQDQWRRNEINARHLIESVAPFRICPCASARAGLDARFAQFQTGSPPMARVTVEDCVDKVPNRFDLVMLAAHRARVMSSGAPLLVDRDNDKNPVVSLREIADETQAASDLRERMIESHQSQIEVDEAEEDAMALLMGAEVDRPAQDDMDEERLLRQLMEAQGQG